MTPISFLSRACPVCASTSARAEASSDQRAEDLSLDQLRPYWSGLFKKKVFFSYDRCAACGVLFAPTYFSDEQLEQLYADMAPNMEVVPTASLEATQRGYWDVTAGTAPLDGGYLEIGPDVGYIVRLAVAEARFDHYWLFEPNGAVHGALAQAAGNAPHDISLEMNDLSIVPDRSVGLAVMVHVLDHLLDPRAMLERIRVKLKPGGVLMIVTHNEASLLRKLMASRWPPFCLQHPELYSPASIKTLVRRAAYQKVEVQRSVNYFPIDFMVRQAAYTVGIDLGKIPLPKAALGLKLGNMITLAHV
ncbi:class I SAM-dependent methyltransferase [Sphingomonas sp. PvP056]|jgi:SAM-dependent methyltransferase|uniref:class I SAM-dependent methyltransferase n=1 Tax=Sphingomonas sp. PvP056 TaxID=3156392 RepID=UPI00339A0A7A